MPALLTISGSSGKDVTMPVVEFVFVSVCAVTCVRALHAGLNTQLGLSNMQNHGGVFSPAMARCSKALRLVGQCVSISLHPSLWTPDSSSCFSSFITPSSGSHTPFIALLVKRNALYFVCIPQNLFVLSIKSNKRHNRQEVWVDEWVKKHYIFVQEAGVHPCETRSQH